jgi:hypothetical protein
MKDEVPFVILKSPGGAQRTEGSQDARIISRSFAALRYVGA